MFGAWIRIGFFAASLIGCAHIERTEALLYLKEVEAIHRQLEPDALEKCGYNFDIEPGFWPASVEELGGSRGSLRGRIIIFYPASDTSVVAHEASHFYDENGPGGRRVSWECLSEVKADLIDIIVHQRRVIIGQRRYYENKNKMRR